MTAFRLGLFSAMIAMGGLPLYLYLPDFASASLGVSLAAIGVILMALRALDMAQDVFIGRFLDRFASKLKAIALIAMGLMAAGFLSVFVMPAWPNATLQLFIGCALLFTGHSTLYILLYRQSSLMQTQGHPSAARVREIGLLVGVVIGTTLPNLANHLGLDPLWFFGLMAAGFGVFATLLSLPIWQNRGQGEQAMRWRDFRHTGAGRVLVLVFFNSLPVAVTATLFGFFVRDRLALEQFGGLFLASFFLAMLAGVFLFGRVYRHDIAKLLLITTMGATILSFLWAYFLPEGALLRFALICVVSGFFMGAELYILPVLLAEILQRQQIASGGAFGAWSMLNKLALAIAAALLLPTLQAAGYAPNSVNSVQSLGVLAAAYALFPALLKLIALFIVFTLPKEI